MKTKLLLVAGLILAATAVPAMAQTATTNVNMNMPSLILLYHRGTVTFDVTAADMAGLVGAAVTNDEGNVTISGLAGDAGVSGTPFTEPSSLVGEATNFWGVRSMAPAGQNTQVSVSVTGATLTNGAGSIGIANATTKLTAGAWPGAGSVSFAPTGMAIGNIQLGDVRFDVDLSAATVSGSYTGGVITITAANL